jgi:hypothetical protein
MSKRWASVIVALTITSVLAVGAAARDERGRASRLTFKLDPFVCYSIEPDGTPFRRTVGSFLVTDQFRPPRSTRVTSPYSLCAPAAKIGAKPRNGSAHLLCYGSRYPHTLPTRTVEVTNDLFVQSRLAVGQPVFLCVPSGKSLDPDALPRPSRGLDHFQCYRVKGKRSARRGNVQDQFGAGKYQVGAPLLLCNPATKRKLKVRESVRLINARDHLVCYAVGLKIKPRKHLLVLNQFEPQGLHLNTRTTPNTNTAVKLLCLPSLKREIS